jgi:hypothetical protein
MVAPLYTDVSAGIRAALDDLVVPGGAVYTDGYCQKYIEMAQQTMVGYLIANSVERMKFRTETPLTVTALTTILDYQASAGGVAGAGVLLILPDDLVTPDQLWEAKIGGTNEDFVSMNGPNEIPRLPQADTLRYWNWANGRVHLIGSTVDRLVRMDYWSALSAIDPAGRIKIVASGNALIYLAASLCAASKGQYSLADRFATFDKDVIGGRAGFELLNIINAEVKVGQSEAARRLPYFGRNRYSVSDTWNRGRN